MVLGITPANLKVLVEQEKSKGKITPVKSGVI
jgi:hypothetical protein